MLQTERKRDFDAGVSESSLQSPNEMVSVTESVGPSFDLEAGREINLRHLKLPALFSPEYGL